MESQTPVGTTEITVRTGKPKTDRFSRLRSLLGQRVAIQEKIGPVIVGQFDSFDEGEGYLTITEPVISGRARKARPPFVLVHFTAIAHIHQEVETEKV